ncbi:MAG: histidinol phosphate phosphatase domain-containing protein [Syntrophales bacterium]|jgi:histidinol phosphatase-like PHP family hydrolase
MIDLHTHSIYSDGELIPAELLRRASVVGYKALAITDHADHSNLEFIISSMIKVADILSSNGPVRLIPGVEITHIPPSLIQGLVKQARSLGARVIVVHGETIAEPVLRGTNRSALMSDIDILAHPGLIMEDDVRLAVEKGVYIEITTRRGHCLTNGHVASLARKHHGKLVLNTDSHASEDLCSMTRAADIAMGAGMTSDEVDRMFRNSEDLLNGLK